MNTFISELHSLIDKILLDNQTYNREDQLRLRESLIALLDECMNKISIQKQDERNNTLDHIQADLITVEVIDQLSGQIFRRKLDVNFFENHNGLKLKGENLEGSSSEIVFLSNQGIKKINDLIGNGPNKDLCDNK